MDKAQVSATADTIGPLQTVLPAMVAVNGSREAGATPLHDSSIHDAPPTSPIRSKARLWAIMASLYTTLFLAALDVSIVSTAIPTISSSLHSASGYTWIGGAYLLGQATAAPIWARLSDIWGRKPIFLGVVGLFFGASIFCALSTSMAMLIAARAIQGVAGGGIFQLVAIITSDLFSMRQRTIFFGFMEIIWAFASGIGPVLGGAMAQKLSWRWIWWINTPLSGVAFVLLLFSLNVHNPKTRLMDGLKALDWFGTIAIIGVTLMLLLGFEFGGQEYPWSSPRVVCPIVFGSLMIFVFLLCEKKIAKYPLMPMGLFTNRSTLGSLLVDFCFSLVFVVQQYFIPLYLQSVLGASPIRSGVLLIPLVLTASLVGLITGLTIHRTGRYILLVWAGTATVCLGVGLYIMLGVSSSIALVVGVQLVSGIGSGMLFQPPLIALQAHVEQNDVATATATFGFVREIAAAIGVVIGGVIFQNCMSSRSASLKAARASPEVIAQFQGTNAAANTLIVSTIADEAVRTAVKEAYAFSLRNMWICLTAIAALAIAASSLLRHKTLTEEHTETQTGLQRREKA